VLRREFLLVSVRSQFPSLLAPHSVTCNSRKALLARAKRRGGYAYQPTEARGEMALGLVSDFERDIGDRQLSLGQQLFCTVEAAANDVLVRRISGRVPGPDPARALLCFRPSADEDPRP